MLVASGGARAGDELLCGGLSGFAPKTGTAGAPVLPLVEAPNLGLTVFFAETDVRHGRFDDLRRRLS